jgi:NAD(P)-dependent dehydrogenase (short-subunit alcohol dehydrogenase family)
VLICRDRARGEAAAAWITVRDPSAAIEVVLADLSLLSATRVAGSTIAATHPRIALLVNNAGVFEAHQVTTPEGHDRVLATNLLAPFVLTEALLPSLERAAPSRIVNVGSSRADRGRLDPRQLVLGRRWSMTRAYDQSKLALALVTFEFARRLADTGVTANLVHPGLVATGLVRAGGLIGLAWRGLALLALSEEQGADTPLHAALAPELATVTGVYFKKRRVVPPNPQALEPGMAASVWAETARLAAGPSGAISG